MAIKISKKIKGYNVVKPEGKTPDAAKIAPSISVPDLASAEIIQMHEKVERPECLVGATFKIKSPLFEHALYVTINDIVLNRGTPHELRRPFEIFINSKNMDHFQWIVALTRIMSAVFRKGGDVTFLVEELKAVFDPRGGYFKAGGVYMPSIVAELGAVIEDHLKNIGMLHDPEMSVEQKRLIAEKRASYEARSKKNSDLVPEPSNEDAISGNSISPDLAGAGAETASKDAFPPTATMCQKCHAKAVVVLDGCATCLSCGYSKCG